MRSVKAGNQAEKSVSVHLAGLGFKIIKRNWKNRFSEIDIIAKKDDRIYFVEVKFRFDNKAGDGFDYITGKKLAHMVRAAEGWVAENEWQGEYVLMAAAVSNGNEIDLREIA